jgi:transcriptional regulator with XRE-family HTH domain
MDDRSNLISRLLESQKARTAYIKAKLSVLVPAQIRAARLKSTTPPMPKQKDLAREAGLQQSRISMFETPGAANITLETLAKIAAGLRVGVIVKFVPFHEMLRWDNAFSPSAFDVQPRLEQDEFFLNPATVGEEDRMIAELDDINSNTQGDFAREQDNPQAGNAKRPMGKAQAAEGAGDTNAAGATAGA